MRKPLIMIIKVNDVYELPVNICETIKEASEWIDCDESTLYKNMHTTGVMQAKGYKLELVEV